MTASELFYIKFILTRVYVPCWILISISRSSIYRYHQHDEKKKKVMWKYKEMIEKG